MKIGELFVELGFMSGDDGKKLNDFARGIGNLNLSSIAAVLGVGALYEALRRMTEQAVAAGLAIHSFGVQTGLSTSAMQQWSFFAEQMGASGEDVANALKSIQMQQAKIKIGQGNPNVFSMIGASVSDDPFKVLESLQKKYKMLRPDLQRLINSEFGLSDAMLNVLKASDEQISKIGKIKVASDGANESIVKMRETWVEIRQALFRFSNAVIAALAPAFEHIGKLLMDLGRGIEIIFQFKAALIVLGSTLLIMFAPVVAAITAFVLLIDDMYTYFEGGEAALMPLWKGIDKVSESIIWLVDNLKVAFDWFEKITGKASDFSSKNISLVAGPLGAGAAAAAGVSNNTRSQNNNIVLNIAAGTPMSVANAIQEALKKVLSDADYAKGVKST